MTDAINTVCVFCEDQSVDIKILINGFICLLNDLISMTAYV